MPYEGRGVEEADKAVLSPKNHLFETAIFQRAMDLNVDASVRAVHVSTIQHPVPKSFFRVVSVADPFTGVKSNTGTGFFLPSLTATTAEPRGLPKQPRSMPSLPAIAVVAPS